MNQNDLVVRKGVKVFVDKKTNARTIALPFRLPDESSAIIMVSRLKNEEWNPNIIKSITITYEN